ncbi:hypothetical protein C1646_695115 [Rhizophagus diaphanus]|uniref:Uncharacterized protein n=1 Tax=Rhizophagus irregularis TaxID=588596 RepID=A0A2I1FVA0_9GLOM|nr:hypothetical protein RhiirA4_391667 [Rhizophagus irregularis]RGB37347.1 hypothetical protein C1646_695115 [Rhizophagus diaphanus] [Rhizophagus sp. MUCL 43196]
MNQKNFYKKSFQHLLQKHQCLIMQDFVEFFQFKILDESLIMFLNHQLILLDHLSIL